jgi:hypothetical protein
VSVNNEAKTPVPPVVISLDSYTTAAFHTVFCDSESKRMVVEHSPGAGARREPSYSLELVFHPNGRNASGASVLVLGEHGWWKLAELPLGEIFRVTAALLYRHPSPYRVLSEATP